MKKRRSTRFKATDLIVVFAALLVFSSAVYIFWKDLNSQGNYSGEPVATITFKKNLSQRRVKNEMIWYRVRNGMDLYDGDYIRVEEGSQIKFSFNDDETLVDLSENTIIQIQKRDDGSYAMLSLGAGEISIDTSASKNNFSIVNENGTEIKLDKGAKMSVKTSGNGKVDFKVHSGSATLINTQTDSQSHFNAGEEISMINMTDAVLPDAFIIEEPAAEPEPEPEPEVKEEQPVVQEPEVPAVKKTETVRKPKTDRPGAVQNKPARPEPVKQEATKTEPVQVQPVAAEENKAESPEPVPAPAEQKQPEQKPVVQQEVKSAEPEPQPEPEPAPQPEPEPQPQPVTQTQESQKTEPAPQPQKDPGPVPAESEPQPVPEPEKEESAPAKTEPVKEEQKPAPEVSQPEPVQKKPEPLLMPVLFEPKANTIFGVDDVRNHKSIVFEWKEVENATEYVFRLVKKSGSLTTIIVEEKVYGLPRYVLKDIATLSNGDFVWSVTAVKRGKDLSIEQKSATASSQFEIQVQLPQKVKTQDTGRQYGD
ncbi:MAG: hypothetical protein MJ169_01155 [Treponema sp.]|nr:hypothetical protein [Treponema sp.]